MTTSQTSSSQNDELDGRLKIGNHVLSSRLIIGTGKYESLQQMKGAAEQAFRFGSSLSTGLYLIEVRQEDDLKTVK